MKSRKLAAMTLAATMTGAFGMSACSSNPEPGSTLSNESTHPASTSAAPAAASTAAETAAATTALLLLNDSLRSKLGEAYSDSWIEDNHLHVAVTTDAAVAMVTEAGAIAKLVTLDAAQLEAAVQAVAAWQAGLPGSLGTAIHKIIPDGRTGTLTLFVAADRLDAVSQAAAADKPTGAIPLLIKESTGLATAF